MLGDGKATSPETFRCGGIIQKKPLESKKKVNPVFPGHAAVGGRAGAWVGVSLSGHLISPQGFRPRRVILDVDADRQ
jgi:hypothetical protein